MDSIFHEIFGYEDVKPTTITKAVTLPMDSELYPYESVNGASDGLCKALQDESFISEIVGDRAPVTHASATPAFELDFTKIWTQASDRASRVHKAAPERRHAISAIVEQARQKTPVRVRNSDRWNCLTVACERFCTAALLEA